MSRSGARFDAEYYKRYYESRRTRVQGPKEVAHLARGVVQIIDWLGVEVRTALDVGAGTGLWRDWFKRHRPHVRYRSTDVSAYACNAYGHEQRDIAKWRARERFDLVICQGVLPYLPDPDAERAIENLGAMCKGLMYLEASTERDFALTCDLELTDPTLIPRTGRWYRERLEQHFDMLGLGLWASQRYQLPLYELETGTLRS